MFAFHVRLQIAGCRVRLATLTALVLCSLSVVSASFKRLQAAKRADEADGQVCGSGGCGKGALFVERLVAEGTCVGSLLHIYFFVACKALVSWCHIQTRFQFC